MDADDLPAWSRAIIEKRLELGLTQEQLAARIGIHKQQLSNWERGRNTPLDDSADRLEQVLGIRLDERAARRGRGAVRGTTPLSAIDFESYPKSFEWLTGFLHQLARAGAKPLEVEAARELLSRNAVVTLAARTGKGPSDSLVLSLLRGIGEPILRGIKRAGG